MVQVVEEIIAIMSFPIRIAQHDMVAIFMHYAEELFESRLFLVVEGFFYVGVKVGCGI